VWVGANRRTPQLQPRFFLLLCINLPTVLLKKDIDQHEGKALVAINKRMILAEMKSVGSGFVKECLVNELASNSPFRRRCDSNDRQGA
jgi:hypothetical protein